MLKRLELVGFKSFADRTTFDFADGVTGIIGPNGSGKSNVVDAVRWVLGEQSARSLRGGEMTDVIFNGSTSRRSLGLAEVSMHFDNRKRVLATDADDVQITRRVYRSGEGEYLINNQPSRLKDIKDLFLGSGAGTDAYCIIQQGQVDILLQTAPKERRTIFEEAAGISRFKAKKIEALRKLERTDANLQRVRDVLDESEKRLRTVNMQAAKARRHQEYTARLRELRVALSLREYHTLEDKLTADSALLEEIRVQLASESSAADEREQELTTLESRLSELEAAVRHEESQLAAARQGLAGEQVRQEGGWSALAKLEEELGQGRKRLAIVKREVVESMISWQRSQEEFLQAEARCAEQRQEIDQLQQEFAATAIRSTELREEGERQESLHLEQMHLAARHHNEAVGWKAQLDSLLRERRNKLARSEQAAEHLASLEFEVQELTLEADALQERLGEARAVQLALVEQRDALNQRRDEGSCQAADLRAERSGLTSRIEVLENLERSHEGLGTGVREVLEHLQNSQGGPWQTVVGIVAELLTVRREFAPLIDLALGERAQRFLVRDVEELAQALRERGRPFSGRVSFLPITVSSRQPTAPSAAVVHGKSGWGNAGTSGHPGVVASADEVVRCEDPRFPDLPSLLLGKTLIVRDLTAARAIAGLRVGFRCITLAGDLLEPDGTLTVGTYHAEAGILSRKSELRELRDRLVKLDDQVAELEREMEELRIQAGQLDARISQAGREIEVLATQSSDMRLRLEQHRHRREGLNEEVSLNQSELSTLEEEIDRLQQAWEDARTREEDAEVAVAAARARLQGIEQEVRAVETLRTDQQQQAMVRRVALATAEERALGLRQRQEQQETERDRRQEECQRLASRLASLTERLTEAERELLTSMMIMADLYHRKESAECLLGGWHQERASLRQRRLELAELVQVGRGAWKQQQEIAHDKELAVNSHRHLLTSLADRMREDYQLDLDGLYRKMLADGHREALAGPLVAPVAEGEEAGMSPEDEIVELKKKLGKLGSVNLEAIDELRDLEAKHSTLQIQFDDLTASQRILQDIIARINNDSRRLFTETFDAIRTNFQELFRKLFGGGMADIVLEEGEDILESGIEIVARPPGKELRSISLMSGGEKTMTAVALLMAIFRSKPSPFCILDEVDAALDEANVARFTSVLREFLDRSQFIIITHHKRTMAAADVLYGVTMQEPGVSTRFSARFEDYPDEERQAA